MSGSGLDGGIVVRKLKIKFRLPQARIAADLDPGMLLVSSRTDSLWIGNQGRDGGVQKGELRAWEAGKSLLNVVQDSWENPKVASSGNDESSSQQKHPRLM